MSKLNTSTLYQKLIEHMDEAVWVGDENERTVYANPKFLNLLNYELKEILGKKSYEFWDEESAKKVRGVNKNLRHKGISSSYEGNLQSKDGEKIPVLLHGSPLPGGGTIGIMTDLTELKEKESLYSQLVNNMNEGVWFGDKDEKTLFANRRYCEMTGYSLDEIVGKEAYQLWDAESVKKVKEVNKLRKKGISSSYEATLLNKSGKHIPVLASGSPLKNGGTMGIVMDLSELKAKAESEKILNRAVEYANDAIIIFNENFKIESWNKGAKTIFGHKKEEILGANLSEIIKKEDLKGLLESNEMVYNHQLTGIHKNKNDLHISATITPIEHQYERNKATYLLIARDISNQKKFQEELTVKYNKMREAYNKFGIVRRQMDYSFELLDMCKYFHDKKTIADFVVSSIIMLTKVDACTFRLYNTQKDTLELIACFGVEEEWRGKASVPYKGSLTEQAFNKKMPMKIIDVAKNHRYKSKHLVKKHNLCSLLLIPLVFRSELVGSLSLYAKPEKKLEIFENEFIEQYAKIIELIAGSILRN